MSRNTHVEYLHTWKKWSHGMCVDFRVVRTCLICSVPAANSSLSAGATVFRPAATVATQTAATANTDVSAVDGGPSSAATDGRQR